MSLHISELYKIFLESTGVTTDSRNILPYNLFFALKGENFDGNKYAQSAIEKGAIASVIDNPEFATGKTILVDDVLKALQELAHYHRQQLNIPIIGITGTNGKTTTKELINAVLSRRFKVSATKGNLNNHIGVPLTLLSMQNDTEIGIVEMGANHQFEIAELCKIANPNYGIITSIGKAHLEGFGSFENVIKTKKELFDYIVSVDGKYFLNTQCKEILDFSNSYNHSISYGSNNNKVFGEIKNSFPLLELNCSIDNKYETFKSNLVGDYNQMNIITAIAIGDYFKVPVKSMIEAIEEYKPSNIRSELKETNSNTLIIDAYNANPTSMDLSIKSFANIKTDKEKVLILGAMAELGKNTEIEHHKIVELLKDKGLLNVIFVGDEFRTNNIGEYTIFENINDLISFLQSNKITNKLIFIKGSRSVGLEKIVDLL